MIGGNGAILAHPLLRLAANCPAPTAVLVREHLTQLAAPDPAPTAGEALVLRTVLGRLMCLQSLQNAGQTCSGDTNAPVAFKIAC